MKSILSLKCSITKTPVYLRLGREKTPVMTTDSTPFEIGKAQIFFEPNANGATGKVPAKKSFFDRPKKIRSGALDSAIIATGALVYKAILVAKAFEKEGVNVKVVNLATIKPLDEETIIKVAKEAGAIVTVEEHQIRGGMGSVVAECLAKNHPVPIEFVGVNDEFGQSGTPTELIEHYGMGEGAIKAAVQKVLKRK